MHQFSDFLSRLGSLHDVCLIAVNWNADDQVVEFILDDLYANLGGLPGYPGLHKGVIRFEGVTYIEGNIEIIENLRIYECLMINDVNNEILVKFSLGGHIRIRYASVIYPPSLI
jgi:hypothetical protein